MDHTVVVVRTDQDIEKEAESSPTPLVISDIVISILCARVFAGICIAKKWRWLSRYKRRQQNVAVPFPLELKEPHSELNGSCGNANNIEHSEFVRRPHGIEYEAKYDVFICYSSKDIIWVKEVLTELVKRDFVCCIDFKNFIPGVAIVENKSQTIYYSRKTVAVLTPDFVDSEWFSHELQKALTRIRSHQVVPIMYKNCTVPLVLQDRTFLDWENCHVKPYFWDQLENALRLPSDGVMCYDPLASEK